MAHLSMATPDFSSSWGLKGREEEMAIAQISPLRLALKGRITLGGNTFLSYNLGLRIFLSGVDTTSLHPQVLRGA